MLRRHRPGFRLDVEGLRGVAVLAVVLYHARLVTGGYVGVDVFFVLSGFLITRLIWNEMASTGGFSFTGFYARRARRLLPAALVVLVATVAASAALLSPLQAREVVGDAIAAALYTSNVRFAALQTDYLAAAALSPVQHFWSLSVEEQFYLLWPLLLVVCGLGWRRRRPRRQDGSGAWPSPARLAAVLVAIGAGSFAASWWLTRTNQPWAFFSLPTRAWELVAGGLVALAVDRLRHLPRPVTAILGWGGLATIATSILTFGDATPFPGAAALAPVLGTVAVLAAGCTAPESAAGRLLVLRPLPAIGRISYPLYLWHWPVLVLTAAAIGRPVNRVEGIALVVASGLLAAATVQLVEDPVRFAPRLVRHPGRSVSAGVAATALAGVVVVLIGGALPPVRGNVVAAPARALEDPAAAAVRSAGTPSPPAPAEQQTTEAERQVSSVVAGAVATDLVPANLRPSLSRARRDLSAPFVEGCNNSYSDAVVHRCVYGDRNGADSIVLFGDSHAAQWFPALNQLAVDRGWRLIVLTKATCPPLTLPVFSPVLRRPFRECDTWRDGVVRRIAAERPLLVIFGAARHYDRQYRLDVFGPEWISGMASMVEAVRAAGAPALVLGQTPKPAFDVPTCLSKHLRSATSCTTGTATAVDATGAAAERSAVTGAGGRYVDVAPWVCAAGDCAAIVNDLLVFRDDNHLTTTYTAWLAPLLAVEVDSATRRPAQPRSSARVA